MKSFRCYLGDSVYVELDTARRVILTTNNGNPDDPRNIILHGAGGHKRVQLVVGENQDRIGERQ